MTEVPTADRVAANQQIIEEFRKNGGRVGGGFAGVPLLLIITAGARSGRPRTNPLAYRRDGDRLLVFGSNGGRPQDPDWYRNLQADPQVTIEIAGAGPAGIEILAARAVPLAGDERDREYQRQAELNPAFAGYQAATSRPIPVVALHPLDLVAQPEAAGPMADLLERAHRDLRRDLAAVRALAPGEERTRRCSAFIDALRLHHIREDGAFTALRAAFPPLAPALDRFAADHRDLTGPLADLEQALDPASADAWPAAALDRAVAHLDEHFADEERHLLPVLRAAGG